MKHIVISLGGSVIVKENVDFKKLKRLKKIINKSKNKFAIVVGGGKIARYYTKACAELGLSEKESHEIGRDVTLINAKMVAYFLNAQFVYAHPEVVVQEWREKIIVTGGWEPGWNTDVGASIIAAGTDGEMINITNIEYIYNKDPKIKEAKPLKHISWNELSRIINKKHIPGGNVPFHPLAIRVCKKNNVRVISTTFDNFEKMMQGKNWDGTIIE